jgi:hypothetical protein
MNKTFNPIVNWKKYLNDTNPIITKYISKYGRAFIVQTIDKIKKAHITNQSKIILIKFRDSDIISILERKDYAHALELLLNLCIKIEYYEVCTEIQKLITDIKLNKKIKKRKEVVRGLSYNPFF